MTVLLEYGCWVESDESKKTSQAFFFSTVCKHKPITTNLSWLSSSSCLMYTNSSEDWSSTVSSQRNDQYLLSMLLLVDQLVLSPTLTTSLTNYNKYGEWVVKMLNTWNTHTHTLHHYTTHTHTRAMWSFPNINNIIRYDVIISSEVKTAMSNSANLLVVYVLVE